MSQPRTTPAETEPVSEWERDRPWIVLLTGHWLTMAGLLLGISAVCTWLFTLPITLPGHVENPYKGIVLFFLLPLVLAMGLVLAVGGILLGRRRIRKRLPVVVAHRGTALRRLFVFLGVTVAVNLLVGTQLTYRAVVYMDTPEFCGATCHAMQPEHVGHQDSTHASVACAECHIVPGAAGWLAAKMNGTKQMFDQITNDYPRPIPAALASGHLVPSHETCERCHWAEQTSASHLVIISSYASDEQNTRSYTVLEMHVGGTAMEGIHHAHFAGGYEVSYAAVGAKQDTIPWVERRDLRTGETKTYIAEGKTRADVAALPRHTMQCVDCHNRPTHAFQLAEPALDRALALGTVPATLPFIKKQALALLQVSYANSQEAAADIPAAIDAYYRETYPELYAQRKTDIARAGQGVLVVYRRNVFPESGVTWGTYPDHLGHADGSGCFRCHDGKHDTADGKDTIGQDCDSCHELLAMQDAAPDILKTLGLWDKIETAKMP